MVARKYEIYFECEQDISRVSAANERFINAKRNFTGKVCIVLKSKQVCKYTV